MSHAGHLLRECALQGASHIVSVMCLPVPSVILSTAVACFSVEHPRPFRQKWGRKALKNLIKEEALLLMHI